MEEHVEKKGDDVSWNRHTRYESDMYKDDQSLARWRPVYVPGKFISPTCVQSLGKELTDCSIYIDTYESGSMYVYEFIVIQIESCGC